MRIEEEPRQSGPLFLPQERYRRQRLADALRIWPFVFMAFVAVPVVWDAARQSSVAAMMYLFGLWAVFILGGALLARRVRRWSDDADDEAAQ